MRTIVLGIPGFMVVVAVAILAVLLSQYINLSSTLVAILLGFVLSNVVRLPQRLNVGIGWAESHALAAGVALLGLQLNMSVLMQINPLSLAVIVTAILMTFIATFMLAKMLRVNGLQSCLLASGQGICGSAAVMAASKALRSIDQSSAGLIIAVVNFLGFIGVFITTWLVQYYFSNNDIAGGFLIGNTLQSMGHVVAAGFSVNDEVGHGAVLVKMCRILFLVPTLLLLVFYISKSSKVSGINQQNNVDKPSKLQLVPGFIWFFLGFVVLNNLEWIDPEIKRVLSQVGDVLFVLAMVAIGLSIRLQDIWQQGSRLLLLGGMVFLLQIVFTLMWLNLF